VGADEITGFSTPRAASPGAGTIHAANATDCATPPELPLEPPLPLKNLTAPGVLTEEGERWPGIGL